MLCVNTGHTKYRKAHKFPQCSDHCVDYTVNRTAHFLLIIKKIATGTWVCVWGGGGIVFVSETDIAVRSYCNSLTFVMQ